MKLTFDAMKNVHKKEKNSKKVDNFSVSFESFCANSLIVM